MKKGLMPLIPGSLGLLVFVVVLIVLSVTLVQRPPKVSMEAKTSVDKDSYQEYTTLNSLLLHDDGRFVELVREYGNADSQRRQEIKSEIQTIMKEDFSKVKDPRLIVEFENDEIDIGEGATTTARTVIATPDGSALVKLGLSGIKGQKKKKEESGSGETNSESTTRGGQG